MDVKKYFQSYESYCLIKYIMHEIINPLKQKYIGNAFMKMNAWHMCFRVSLQIDSV